MRGAGVGRLSTCLLQLAVSNLGHRAQASRLASVEESGPSVVPSPTSHVRAIVEIRHDKRLPIDYSYTVRVMNAGQPGPK